MAFFLLEHRQVHFCQGLQGCFWVRKLLEKRFRLGGASVVHQHKQVNFFLLHAAKVRSSCEEGPGQSALQSAYHNPQLDEAELKQNRTTLSFRPKITNKQNEVNHKEQKQYPFFFAGGCLGKFRAESPLSQLGIGVKDAIVRVTV